MAEATFVVGVIVSVILILLWLYKSEELPIDNKRRPFSFDEKVKVIELNVLKYGIAMCEKCRATKNFSIDHRVPLARGGHNGVSNLQLLCKNCNSKKGDNA